MSISRAFYLAASLNHMAGHREHAATIEQYSQEHPEDQKLASFVKNGFRPEQF